MTGRPTFARFDGQGVLRLAVHRDADGAYTVRVRDEATRLRITINHEQPDGLVLHASLDLVRRPLTDRNLVRMLLRQPLVTHKTTR